MALTKCEKCAAELAASASACPSCGTPAPVSPAKSDTSKKLIQALGIAAACIVAGLLLATWLRKDSVASQKIPPAINLEDITAKANRGDAEAQKQLGAIYGKGEVVRQDYAEAAKWYRQAADQGHAGAEDALGELYEAGRGVPLDEAQAAKWYRKAAEQGDAAGQYNLAVLYVMGKGVPQNKAEALKWYRQAAEQGDALAQYNLGMRYKVGNGVAPDPTEAYQWLCLAAAQGVQDATGARDELKRRMSSEQISEGKRRVAAFAAKKTVRQSP